MSLPPLHPRSASPALPQRSGLPPLPRLSGGGPFPEEGRKKRPTHSLQIDLTGMPSEELLELRALIDERLPVKDLKDVDFSRELVLQMLSTQRLQRDVLEDDGVPANQKAQTANSVAAILQQLVRLQTEVYTSERLKRIEQALVETINAQPMEEQLKFMAAYEAALKA